MLAANIADRAMSNIHKLHAASVSPVPNFNWISMGPDNIGGRTRAILIDNTDPSHQTIFAAGVSGGVWKSTDGGGTWGNATATISFSQEDTMQNINVCCLAQDSKGAIYAGTGEGFSDYLGGEGFSTAILGGGIFKSTDDGKTWRLLPRTAPSVANNNSVNWAYVNRIAIRPDSFQVIYAATNEGLMVSHDSGATWNYAINSANNRYLSYLSLDVKVSNDGSIVVACVNDAGFYCYPKSGNSNLFTQIHSAGAGRLPANVARIEFAFSPTDANRIYASDINQTGAEDTGSVYMTMTGKANGGYWYRIGPGGNIQSAIYANTLGVPPANKAQVLLGSTTLWEWSGASLNDTVGSWEKVTHENAYFEGDPLWIHTYQHIIVFDTNNPQTVYIGCDGGVFKCSNLYLNPNNVNGTGTGSIANLSFEPINRNYNVTQYYSVCYSPHVNYETVHYNNTTMLQGMGVGGGTQDNGSPYINGTYFPGYPNDAMDMSGGDGGGCAVSQLNPNIAYFSSYYGTLLKTQNLTNLSFPTSAYTQTRGLDDGGNIDSIYRLGTSCYVFPVALYENPYDILNKDSLQFINSTDSNYQAGNTIWPISPNGSVPYPYILTKPLAVGDTIMVPDRVVSRLAVGFSPSEGGIWINGQGASNNTVIWMPIAGPLSTPDAYTSNYGDCIHSLAWSADGNTLFAGTEQGTFFRFSNINSIIANSYKSGALWSNTPGGIVANTTRVISTNLTTALGINGRDILSISVDPANGNNVMVTSGNYGNTKYVFYSNNALDTNGTPTFIAAQGNLPAMPVYCSILDIMDSNGHYITGSAMVGTERGIYTTANINQGASTKWVKNNNDMANVLTLALKQQTMPAWLCNNAGVIYAGTHGRGIWCSNTEYQYPTGVPGEPTPESSANNLLVYPNPMISQGTIQYTLETTDNVSITIYDMQGRQIKILTSGLQSSGKHLITFSSAGIPEGTYFVSLTGNNYRKTTKLLILK